MLGASLIAGLVLQPRAASLRLQLHEPGVDEQVKADFDRAHGQAVQLNGFVLFGGLVLIAGCARRFES